ncbi:MAG: hypothetical protein Q4B60_00140 [Erysipelotrichaceae bacterium]|nr:hypothetical protein [Erysipelotrichaceae bacterium]
MAQQDIYKLVAEMNKNNVSENKKIDDIYDMLDNIGKGNDYSTVNENFSNEKKSATLKDMIKPAIKPKFPTSIRAFDNRSDCFFNILEAVDYGSNNEEYVKGHRTALEKYYEIAKNNTKNFITLEGQVSDEYDNQRMANNNDNFALGYYDGLEYVLRALDKSRDLIAKKIYENLLKELN